MTTAELRESALSQWHSLPSEVQHRMQMALAELVAGECEALAEAFGNAEMARLAIGMCFEGMARPSRPLPPPSIN